MDLKSFKELIKLDGEVMAQNMIPLTLKEVNSLGQRYMEKYLRSYVKTKLLEFVNKYELTVYSLYIHLEHYKD